MKEWMGRYRGLVAALVQHTNIVIEGESLRKHMYEGLYLSTKEWQVLEYIVEHRDVDYRMADMTDALGFRQSYFSKITKSLADMGLIERFHSSDNKKEVYLKPTDYAITVYEYHVSQSSLNYFQPFFDHLESLSDEDINTVAEAIAILSENMVKTRENSDLYKPDKPKRTLVKF